MWGIIILHKELLTVNNQRQIRDHSCAMDHIYVSYSILNFQNRSPVKVLNFCEQINEISESIETRFKSVFYNYFKSRFLRATGLCLNICGMKLVDFSFVQYFKNQLQT